MGTKHSTGSSDVPDKLETQQVKMGRVPEEQPAQKISSDKMERVPEEQPAQKTSSDTGNEMVKACCDQGSASQSTMPPGEEANGFSPAAEETDVQEEGCNLLSLSQNSSSGKGQPTAQTCELDIASPHVEHNLEKAECIPPQIPLEAVEQLEAGARATLLQGNGQSVDVELQKTAGNIHCLADSAVQETPTEMSTCSPPEKEQDSEKRTTAQRESDDSSFEMVAAVYPGVALSEMAGGHCSRKTALVTEHLEAPSSSAAECFGVEVAPLPITEAQAGQNGGCSTLGPQTTDIAKYWTAADTPKEADGESTLAPTALAAPQEKPLASDAVVHADAMSGDTVQNGGAHPTTEAMSSVEEHPATAAIPDTEDEPVTDPPTESFPKVLQELAEPKKSSFMKELDGAHSSPEAIEMVEAQATHPDKCPQTVPIPCAEAKLSPVAQETQLFMATDVDGQARGLSGGPKESAGVLIPVRKPEAKFPKSFYFCCSQCNAGESEVNADLAEQLGC